MLQETKDIVVALINNGRIAHTTNIDSNINEVKKSIKEINQELVNNALVKPETKSNN